MRHHNSVLHGLLQYVPWSMFERLVDEHDADRRVRQLTTRSQLVAMLYAQLSGSASLRELVGGLASHSSRLYHVGAAPASRSTLADANATRPAALFQSLFAHMCGQATRGLKRSLADAVRLIDSTGLRLAGPATEWAAFSANVCGAKLHVVYDPDAGCPLYAAVSPARLHDVVAAKAMPIEPGATYVFDLGYYDFAWWAALDAAGCRIVTRLKTNTPLTVVEERAVPAEAANGGPDSAAILSDRVGFLPMRLARSRKNPFADPVREVCVRLDTGTTLRIFTNDLDASAAEIAALYKRRWQVELFFRCIKQTLKIRHFLGRSENAVRIQIAVALIAYLILQMAHRASRDVPSPLAFTRLVRINLMHRRPVDQLTTPPPKPPADTRQLVIDFSLA
jgi:hypothetical protein